MNGKKEAQGAYIDLSTRAEIDEFNNFKGKRSVALAVMNPEAAFGRASIENSFYSNLMCVSWQ
jgi:hypothetical protein